MTAIPCSLEFRIEGSIDGYGDRCQFHLWLIAEGNSPESAKMLYDNIVLCHNPGMSRPPRRASRVFTISFPEELAKQVLAVADEESRNISELFREAFRSYHIERSHRKLERIRAEAAARAPVKYTEDDVEALVDEIRAENYARRKKTA